MRYLAALLLLILSPFVGEYLLGNLPADPASWAVSFPLLALLYGGGALLIRETVRRLGRGYPTMVAFAVAYGLIEEGIVLATLFNRDFLGLGLLEHGWVPSLGTSPVWTVYVIGIHTVWSILIPIALTERLCPRLGERPWLPIPGLMLTALVYLAGAALMGLLNFYDYSFFPSPAQVLVVAALAAAAIVIGLQLRPRRQRPGPSPAPAAVGAVTMAGGSLHILAQYPSLSPAAMIALMLLAAVATATALTMWSGRTAWTSRHTVAAIGGGLATYAWTGFVTQFGIHGVTTMGLVGQVAFVALAAALWAVAWARTARTTPPG